MELEIRKKLPLWATVKDAYRLTWNNYGYYWKISRSWLLVSLPVFSLYQWLVLPAERKFSCTYGFYEPGKDSPPPVLEVSLLLSMIPKECFLLLITASIAVAWHRLILLNEKTTNEIYFRLDKLVGSYFVFGGAAFTNEVQHRYNRKLQWEQNMKASRRMREVRYSACMQAEYRGAQSPGPLAGRQAPSAVN